MQHTRPLCDRWSVRGLIVAAFAAQGWQFLDMALVVTDRQGKFIGVAGTVICWGNLTWYLWVILLRPSRGPRQSGSAA